MHGKSVGLRMGTIPAGTPCLTLERIRSISRSPGSTATLRPSRTLRWIKRPWCNDHGSSPAGLFTARLPRKHIST